MNKASALPTGKRSSEPEPEEGHQDEGPESIPDTSGKRKREEEDDQGGSIQKKSRTVEGVCSNDFHLNLPGLLILNSKPAGGKSHMLRYLFYRYRALFSYGIFFSRTAFRAGNLDYVPDFKGTPEDKKNYHNFKHMKWNSEKLRALLDKQASYPDEERPLVFVGFDDNISEKAMWEDEAFIDLVTMFRHYNAFVAIATQYINKVCTTARECATDVGLFKMDSKRSIEAAYDSYGMEFEDMKTFKAWLDSNTTPPELHNCCWKDKANDKPWKVVRAPAVIPEFRLEYGKRVGKAQKKGGRKRKRDEDSTDSECSSSQDSDRPPPRKRIVKNKRNRRPFEQNMNQVHGNLSNLGKLHPYVDNPVATKYLEIMKQIKQR